MYLHEYQSLLELRAFGFSVVRFGLAKTLEEAKLLLHSLQLEKAVISSLRDPETKYAASNKDHAIEIAKDFLEDLSDSAFENTVFLQESVFCEKEERFSLLIDYENTGYRLNFSWKEKEYTWTFSEAKELELLSLDPCLQEFLGKFFAFFQWVEGLEISLLCGVFQEDFLIKEAKVFLDTRSLFRREELAKLYDPLVFPTREWQAELFDLDYRELKGDIGCMVSGEGLGLAVLDLIEQKGSKPAALLNFMKGVSKDRLHAGFRIMLSDPNIKAVLLYLFPGVIDCKILAKDLVEILQINHAKIPVIIRIEGKNADEGNALLRKCSLHTAEDLHEAVEKTVGAFQK